MVHACVMGDVAISDGGDIIGCMCNCGGHMLICTIVVNACVGVDASAMVNACAMVGACALVASYMSGQRWTHTVCEVAHIRSAQDFRMLCT